ncbi:MAG: replication factor C large subunit [Candidatus Marsarchaeota archaeon]|jgi:replication factor C large subunit|nr:replication factor C large subunit [Candidatus Marsarchaeota archaeon]MCL5419975.1 replication factor C large subunit [Candidatus Marsarchaeota archaeon]
MLCDKYTPFTLNGLIGNRDSVAGLQQFGLDVLSGKISRPVMIYGPPGTGKTAAARAIAYSNGFELLELNSSDYRDAETIKRKVLPASRTCGLFNKRILIVFDEIDELSAKFDQGAERAIVQLINSSKQPVIFTANDYWNRKIAFLRNYVEKSEFKRVNRYEVAELLHKIAGKEGKEVASEVIDEIARRCNGDVRAALNDLEMMFDAKPEMIGSLSMRDRKMEIFSVLDKIFLSANFDTPRYAAISSDVDMGMLINWIDENIPTRYRSVAEISNSYSALSKASMFYENASRTGYYGYMRYASALMSSGVSISNTGDVSMINRYSFPANIQYMSRVKKGKEAITAVAAKLSGILHSNRKDIVRGSLPLIYAMMKAAKKELGESEVMAFMSRSFNLGEKDIESLSEYYKFTM